MLFLFQTESIKTFLFNINKQNALSLSNYFDNEYIDSV